MVKDNIDTAALPTTAGTPALARNQPKRNVAALGKLLQAGALLFGKTNMDEQAMGGAPAAIGLDDVLVPNWTWKAVFVPATGEHEAWVCWNVRATVYDEEPIAAIQRRFGVRMFPSEGRPWAEHAPTP